MVLKISASWANPCHIIDDKKLYDMLCLLTKDTEAHFVLFVKY